MENSIELGLYWPTMEKKRHEVRKEMFKMPEAQE
jgi:hypothetical protein